MESDSGFSRASTSIKHGTTSAKYIVYVGQCLRKIRDFRFRNASVREMTGCKVQAYERTSVRAYTDSLTTENRPDI